MGSLRRKLILLKLSTLRKVREARVKHIKTNAKRMLKVNVLATVRSLLPLQSIHTDQKRRNTVENQKLWAYVPTWFLISRITFESSACVLLVFCWSTYKSVYMYVHSTSTVYSNRSTQTGVVALPLLLCVYRRWIATDALFSGEIGLPWHLQFLNAKLSMFS